MDLNEYLALPSSLSISALRARMVELGSTIKSDAQIRQWRHKYADRLPDPANCVLIERATGGKVTRQRLRPDDWQAIWPELAKRKTAAKATA
jgi:DNA-binding transcriptional regulator YdaS (Cro superfamily)